MTEERKTLDDLFKDQESILDRRARERREREEAYSKTPEGIAEREAFLERLRKRDAERANEPDPDEEPDEDDEDEDEEENDD
jgi:hypothetical protein